MSSQAIVIMAVLITLELFLLFRAVREWYLLTIFEDSGIATQARVSDLYSKALRPGSYAYYVTYQFNVSERNHQQKQRINYRNYVNLHPGAFIPIKYLDNSPHIARLSGNFTD